MDRIDAQRTVYRLEIIDKSDGESVIDILSSSPIPVPDEGEKMDLLRIAEATSEAAGDDSIPDDAIEDEYVVESRHYTYVGIGTERPEGDLGCDVTLEVSPTS